MRDLIRRTIQMLGPVDEPPFSPELEPCLFSRVTPVAGPAIALLLAALTLLAVAGTAFTAGTVPWFALLCGLGTAAFCVLLPRTAGLWPGSEALTDWEVALDHRLGRRGRW